jgi:hypothetical protein
MHSMNKSFKSLIFFIVVLGYIVISPSAGAIVSSSNSTSSVICTSPSCPVGEMVSCPPAADGCPGGCGNVCTKSTTLITNITITCTTPVCYGGGNQWCPSNANGCPGGCGIICMNPTTPREPLESLLIVGAIVLAIVIVGRKSR